MNTQITQPLNELAAIREEAENRNRCIFCHKEFASWSKINRVCVGCSKRVIFIGAHNAHELKGES